MIEWICRDTEVMVRRADSVAFIWQDAPLALNFLLQDWDSPDQSAPTKALNITVQGCTWRWELGAGRTSAGS
jgi:hypothetical protein